MAWPFETIVGSNCGCDRHPVSSLDPLSIQRTRLSDTHSFKFDGFSIGFYWPSWARWDVCTWMGLWAASAMAAKTVTIAACRCIGWTGERFGIGVRGFWSDGLGFKFFQSSNNPAAWSVSCRLTLRRPRYCLEAQRGAQAGGFCICEVRPGKIHEAPSAAIYSGRFLSPVSRAVPATRMIRGPVGLVSGWGCQIPVSFPSLWISRTGPSGPARNRTRETPNLPMILCLFHTFCGEWSTPLQGPDKPCILPPSAGRTYPHAAGAATRIKLLASP